MNAKSTSSAGSGGDTGTGTGADSPNNLMGAAPMGVATRDAAASVPVGDDPPYVPVDPTLPDGVVPWVLAKMLPADATQPAPKSLAETVLAAAVANKPAMMPRANINDPTSVYVPPPDTPPNPPPAA